MEIAPPNEQALENGLVVVQKAHTVRIHHDDLQILTRATLYCKVET